MASKVNYEDERFQKVETEKTNALSDLEKTYTDMIDKSDKYYQEQINASKEWADTQTELQNQQLEHTTNKIEQQREQTQKDYLKEQSGAYVDWQKQSNEYGAEAEKMAAQGLANTGYSETSQVNMYNTYQNRVAVAREAFVQANLNYDNAIKDAQLQNSSVLAEIAYNAYQQQLELSLQGFQYKNNLILEQANKKTELENTYYNRYLDVLNQINTENAMAEEVRQFEENQKFQAEQAQLDRDLQTQQAQLDRDFQAAQSQLTRNFQAQQAELERKHDKEMLEAQTAKEKELLEIQHKKDMEKLEQQHKNDLALLKKQYEYSKKGSGGGGSSGGSGTVSQSTGSSSSSKNAAAIKATEDKVLSVATPTKQPAVNMQSVINLGYGPINATRLAQLEASGQITSYVKNGQRYYKKTAKTSKLMELYGM